MYLSYMDIAKNKVFLVMAANFSLKPKRIDKCLLLIYLQLNFGIVVSIECIE
jgi:hypothetical protein